MTLIKTVLSIVLLSYSTAFASDDCIQRSEKRGSIQIQMIPAAGGKNCYLSIRNFKNFDPTYRSYVITSAGKFLIFNSFGNGAENQKTGAREYFLFPRIKQLPAYKWDDQTRKLIVTTTSGHNIYFNYEDAEASEMTGGRLSRSSEVSPGNKGGLEISNFQGLLLDLGFKLGSAPSGAPSRTAHFVDRDNRRCSVLNSEVFKYSNNDTALKYSDTELYKFLKNRCTILNL